MISKMSVTHKKWKWLTNCFKTIIITIVNHFPEKDFDWELKSKTIFLNLFKELRDCYKKNNH